MHVFAEGGKPEDPEKSPRSRVENRHKLNPFMASGPEANLGRIATAPTLSQSVFM